MWQDTKRFGGPSFLHLQGEGGDFTEMLVSYHITARCHKSEGHGLNLHPSEGLKSPGSLPVFKLLLALVAIVRVDVPKDTRVYQKVSGLAAWSENCKWYSSLSLGAVVSLFFESV
jgi:hypothetical protein